jgi:hypothetical protein
MGIPNKSVMKSTWPSASSLASHLTLHVDCFNALQGSPRALKRAIALGQPDSRLHDSVILLDHIIQVLALAQANSTRQRTFRFQRLDLGNRSSQWNLDLAIPFPISYGAPINQPDIFKALS